MSSKSKKMILFFGGAADGTFHNVKQPFQAWTSNNYFGAGTTAKYFSHMDKSSAMKFVHENLAADGKLVLVGHSYGGDMAYLVARDTTAQAVECLVTVDPVSRWTFNIAKPAKVKKWINIWVKGFQDHTDLIAVVGGHWGEVQGAENYKVSDASHAQFATLLQPHLATIRNLLN